MVEIVKFAIPEESSSSPFCYMPTSRAILDLLETCRAKGEMAAIMGAPGVGKTMCFEHYEQSIYKRALATEYEDYQRPPRAYLRRMTRVHETPTKMIMRLGESFGAHAWGNTTFKSYDSVSAALRPGVLLMVDEVQLVEERSLDVLRDLHDTTGCGLVVGGNHAALTSGRHVRRMLLSPFISRLRTTLNIEELLPEDLAAFLDHHRVQGARARERLETFATPLFGLRRIARIIGTAREYAGADRPIDLKHIDAAIALLGIGE